MPFSKNIILFLFSVFSISCLAQDSDAQIHKEINQEVWKPFCESYASLDVETYNNLHSDEVIRATPWGIRVGDEYKNHNAERFKISKEKGTNRTIELWFEHRKSTPKVSYEVGYYKVTYKNNDSLKYSYGRFHVVLKKENGVWKIIQDWDTDKINGVEVTEKDWLKGAPLTFE